MDAPSRSQLQIRPGRASHADIARRILNSKESSAAEQLLAAKVLELTEAVEELMVLSSQAAQEHRKELAVRDQELTKLRTRVVQDFEAAVDARVDERLGAVADAVEVQ